MAKSLKLLTCLLLVACDLSRITTTTVPDGVTTTTTAPGGGTTTTTAAAGETTTTTVPDGGTTTTTAPGGGTTTTTAAAGETTTTTAPAGGTTTTTAAAGETTTTTAPAGGTTTTTAPAGGTTTTTAPAGGTTTTTAAAGETTTTTAPAGGTTTTTAPAGGTTTTTAPAGGTTTTDSANTATTTVKPGPCDSNPCPDGSTCQERADKEYICICQTGYYNYTENICVPAKAFPGELAIGIPYTPEMKDTTSNAFKTAADKIVADLEKVYGDKPKRKYVETIVIKLSPPPMRTKTTGLLAAVDIIFDLSSEVTLDEVKEDITEAQVGAFTKCSSTLCDSVSTKGCLDTDTVEGFNCTCKAEYVPSKFTNRLCVACPSGTQAVGENCDPCSLGYTGFNCADNWQMILMIVGSVLGFLLLVTTIVLTVVTVNSKKKLKKAKATNYEKPHSKAPQVNNGLPAAGKAAPSDSMSGYGGNGVPRIPRAVNDNWDRNTNLEMVPSNSRQNLIPRNSRRFDDQEDTNPYNRPMRPQSNPYAGGRPQTNPYASNQGHSNPYYRN